MELFFEWDEEKALKNLAKHSISFEEAITIFNDPLLLTFPDIEHSDQEQRFINIGISSNNRTLIVIHTERTNYIRIISSRKAVAQERKVYEQGYS